MRKRFSLVLLLLSGLLINACKPTVDLNDTYKEIDVVYGMLNINDTVQYIKIEKGFQNTGNTSAYTVAQRSDSLYHKDTLQVMLQEWRNGAVQQSVSLRKIYNTDKQAGTFASPGQYLYRTPPGFMLDHGADYYMLTIKNPLTNVTSSARTAVVDTLTPESPQPYGSLSIPKDLTQYMAVSFLTGANARFYDVTLVFHYDEQIGNDTTTRHQDSLVYPMASYTTTDNLQGNASFKVSVKTSDFLSFIQGHLKESKTLTRGIGKVDLLIDGGGQDLYDYINVFTPSPGIVQKKNSYTNITNGQGIFSSRTHYKLTVPISGTGRTVLSTSTFTSKLNFVR